MVEYETIESAEIKFGRNNFIEVARKKAVSEEGENMFVSISRGYYLEDGSKKWKASIALPTEQDKREEIAELIKTI
ncbi:MAG TPA: hypothetical protein ENN54_00765 [Thermoplasmatales archaeon]|nr:hypothetical protein [Candidatus Thermoplasmatota archaeon]HDS58817.1 hypothetical protein [Thermoplasmatales archaeon]